MPFKSSGKIDLSNKDVLSFTFDNPSYDLDKPVSTAKNIVKSGWSSSFSSIQQIQQITTLTKQLWKQYDNSSLAWNMPESREVIQYAFTASILCSIRYSFLPLSVWGVFQQAQIQAIQNQNSHMLSRSPKWNSFSRNQKYFQICKQHSRRMASMWVASYLFLTHYRIKQFHRDTNHGEHSFNMVKQIGYDLTMNDSR